MILFLSLGIVLFHDNVNWCVCVCVCAGKSFVIFHSLEYGGLSTMCSYIFLFLDIFLYYFFDSFLSKLF